MGKEQITYCLRVKSTGELVRVSVRSNEGGYACCSETHQLVAGKFWESCRVYEQTSPLKLHRIMMRDTPDYNAVYDSPMHGDIEMEDVEIVERRITEQLKVVVFEPPREFRMVSQTRKPAMILRRYANVDTLEAGVEYLTFLAVPEGETAESVKRFEGSEVHLSDGVSVLKLWKLAQDLPEEYCDILGTGHFAAITSERRYS